MSKFQWALIIGAFVVFVAAESNRVVKEWTPSKHALTVDSSPNAGAKITVSPADKENKSDGETLFSRAYNKGVEVTLTAPENFKDSKFSKWLINGVGHAERSVRIPMNADSSAIAVFAPVADTGSATHTLTVQSIPEAGAKITVAPPDKENKSDGDTVFSCVYNQGVQVTLTASESFNDLEFSKWFINGVGHAERSVRIPMNADTNAVAVFQKTNGHVKDFIDAAIKIDPSTQQPIKLVFEKEGKQIIFGVEDIPPEDIPPVEDDPDRDDPVAGRQRRSLMAQRYARAFWGEEYKHLYPSKEEFQKMDSRVVKTEEAVGKLDSRIGGVETRLTNLETKTLPEMQRNIVKEVTEETRRLLAPQDQQPNAEKNELK